MLMQANRFQEAETEFKEVLEKDKLNVKAKSGLAKTYFHLEKYSVAAVIFEELTKNGKANAMLTETIKRLQAEMDQKNIQIDALKAELEQKNIKINEYFFFGNIQANKWFFIVSCFFKN